MKRPCFKKTENFDLTNVFGKGGLIIHFQKGLHFTRFTRERLSSLTCHDQVLK